MLRYTFLILAVAILSCKKDATTPAPPPAGPPAAGIVSFNFQGHSPVVTMNNTNRSVTAKFPPNFLSGTGLIAEFSLTTGARATVDNIEQVSGTTVNDFNRAIEYKISAPGYSNSSWNVVATNNDQTYKWGLGHFSKPQVSLTKPYEWYIDQAYTGTYSNVNCGPSSVTMAIKWADPSFAQTPQHARAIYGSGGGWWFTSYIISYLNDNGIPNATIGAGPSADSIWVKLTRQLDRGRPVILCLDMHRIRKAAIPLTGSRADVFYNTTPNWGHFIVVKGYREVDGMKYFETYDPFSYGLKNPDDQTLRGRGRYYRYDDIYTAVSTWWNFAIVVNPKGVPIDPSTLRMAVDPATVPEARGR